MTTTSSTTTSNTSATSSIISALGAGSGIDMTGLASQLSAAQFAGRIDRLSARSETLEAQISSASNLKSMVLSLSTSLGDRIRVGDLAPAPAMDNGAVASVSLSKSVTPSGSYSVEVTQLAQNQVLASPAVASTDTAIGAGTITLRFGQVTGAGFTEDAAQPSVDIAIGSGATLADVAAAINGSDSGVTAYVADTVNGPRLVMKGAEGAQNGFVLDVTEDAAEPGLSALAWQPGSATGTLVQASQDAALTLDGMAITSASNTLTDVVPGVKMVLTATNIGAPTTLRFSDASESISGAMEDLTAALNEIMAELNTATDPATGDLARDSGARALKNSLRTLAGTVIMGNVAEGGVRTLSDLGLGINRDGTFSLDSEQLAATLARDPEGAAAMFTTGLYGIYSTMDGISRAASSTGNPSSLAGSIARYDDQLDAVGEDQDTLAEKQEALRQRLVTRFAASDSRVSASQSTLAFLESQIAAWNSAD
ncbi:flagellar filament capping protein FliD [Croceicoccus mobilis]|nr:flagellar filament capping protein FliD [Croceicoccus mobilis]